MTSGSVAGVGKVMTNRPEPQAQQEGDHRVWHVPQEGKLRVLWGPGREFNPAGTSGRWPLARTWKTGAINIWEAPRAGESVTFQETAGHR